MNKTKRPLSGGKKIVILVVTLALVVGMCYLGYYLIRYTFYNDYRQLLSSYSYEQGSELTLSKDSLEGYADYKLVTSNDVLALYLNKKTTDVAILDKRSGEITFAAPPEAESDPVANNVNKSYLQSHIIVNYFNASRTEGIYDSYKMSVSRDQFAFEGIENGVRVIYEMGDFSNSSSTVPQYLSIEKFDEIVALLSEDDAKSFSRYYSTSSDVDGMRQLLKTARSNRMVQQKLQAMLDGVGFTEEDFVEQMALAGTSVTIPVSFKVALEYRLEGDHVDVSVPVSAIEENGGASIYRIQLLRNFGAADSSQNGYIVVPNGDGSIINFNNGKTNASNYSQFVYGIDMLAADYTVTESSNNATMALFALCKENSTILATIEDGASLASVTAGVSKKINNYNYAYATFVIRGNETLEMFGTTGNEAALPIVEPNPYDCNLTVRYTFLDESHKGYNGIAKYYRDRLISEGVLKPSSDQGDISFYYDVVTGVEMTEFFLGKQYMGLSSMTTFEEATEISRQLNQLGITNQVMNLQGWFNGGYYHDVADRIRVPLKLGGKGGLEELSQIVTESGGIVYLDVAFQNVSYESKRYDYQAESAKYYGSGYVASFGQVNPVTLRQTSSLGYSETMYDLISPKFLVRYVSKFADKVTDYEVSGVSLRDLGSSLHSDKKRTNLIHREQALDVVLAQLATIEATGKSVLVNKANDYAWSVADRILNLPLNDNDYVIIDENIPLYEMIIHGSIDYCGEVYNLTNVSQSRQQVLTMIEYGAAPHFVFTWEPTTEMKYSGLNGKYSTTFSTWAETAASVYGEVNEALSQVTGAQMEHHEILANGLRKVTYSNGISIYINYTETDLSADGITVPAMGYSVK